MLQAGLPSLSSLEAAVPLLTWPIPAVTIADKTASVEVTNESTEPEVGRLVTVLNQKTAGVPIEKSFDDYSLLEDKVTAIISAHDSEKLFEVPRFFERYVRWYAWFFRPS
jgi:hypothetical protein